MLLAIITTILVVVIDRLVKNWTTGSLLLHESKAGIDGVFDFFYIHNDGAGFGLFSGKMWLFVSVTILIVIYLLYLIYRHRDAKWYLTLSYGLLLGGAIGNFIDRILYGYVIDMIRLQFMSFPIFNIADMALSIGVVLLIIQVLLDQNSEDLL